MVAGQATSCHEKISAATRDQRPQRYLRNNSLLQRLWGHPGGGFFMHVKRVVAMANRVRVSASGNIFLRGNLVFTCYGRAFPYARLWSHLFQKQIFKPPLPAKETVGAKHGGACLDFQATPIVGLGCGWPEYVIRISAIVRKEKHPEIVGVPAEVGCTKVALRHGMARGFDKLLSVQCIHIIPRKAAAERGRLADLWDNPFESRQCNGGRIACAVQKDFRLHGTQASQGAKCQMPPVAVKLRSRQHCMVKPFNAGGGHLFVA